MMPSAMFTYVEMMLPRAVDEESMIQRARDEVRLYDADVAVERKR